MPESDYSSLSRDTVFDLLSNSRRRFVLHYLRRADGPVSLGELAAEIASVENDIPVDELTSQQRKRTYVSLYQTHIPKLQDAGAVTYDPETGMVTLASGADRIGDYFRQDASEIPWQRYYLALVAVGLPVYFAASILGVDQTTQFVIGLAIIGAFAALAITQFIYSQRRNGQFPPDLVGSDR
ncbi:DUF7344 domain-containing protein (plasmid) [Haloferacaceae archaeon DSL9]